MKSVCSFIPDVIFVASAFIKCLKQADKILPLASFQWYFHA